MTTDHLALLHRIQEAAVSSSTNLGEVLRMCKVLASKLGSEPLAEWLIWEADGYPDGVPLPPYRVWRMELKGYFAGPFGSGLKNAPIPPVCIPESVREQATTYECRQGVSSLSLEVEAMKPGSVLEVSTGNLSVLLGQKVYRGMNCIQAWGVISSSQLVEIVDVVRNKVLDFALRLEKQLPSDAGAGTAALPSDNVTQVFNTVVYGDVSGVIGSASHSTVSVVNVQAGDLASLKSFLEAQGLDSKELGELQKALEAEPALDGRENYGPEVSNWIARMVSKAASGAWEVGLDAAGTLLSSALLRYYGLA